MTRSKGEKQQTIHNRIREYREKVGISQVEFSRQMGVSNRAAWQWENNFIGPSQEHADMICDFFGVDNPDMFYIPLRSNRL